MHIIARTDDSCSTPGNALNSCESQPAHIHTSHSIGRQNIIGFIVVSVVLSLLLLAWCIFGGWGRRTIALLKKCRRATRVCRNSEKEPPASPARTQITTLEGDSELSLIEKHSGQFCPSTSSLKVPLP
ncbi:hypothetical protein SISSUDRAFT_1039694 [Sistotremastrum suecicum HHB10207 ss-3]|uniref:Uncharacterized protein n=1 Tax=Sistotremastrum suecicum HHB10207 ss-3 TaxID=1314776 RepID=A0A166IJA1_9AGAM|nr:hypothetical protein SISSUDRAFT_1039694 [Sistotremastrum suecicum HHB10207 ss-3]